MRSEFVMGNVMEALVMVVSLESRDFCEPTAIVPEFDDPCILPSQRYTRLDATRTAILHWSKPFF